MSTIGTPTHAAPGGYPCDNCEEERIPGYPGDEYAGPYRTETDWQHVKVAVLVPDSEGVHAVRWLHLCPTCKHNPTRFRQMGVVPPGGEA